MANAPVTRAELEEAAADLAVWRDSMHVSVCTLLRLAESVIAALDRPASDDEIDADQVAYFGSTLEDGTVVIDADEDHIMAYDQGRGDERRYLLARLVKEEG